MTATYTPQAVIDQAIAALDLPRCACPGCGRVTPAPGVLLCVPCQPDAVGQTNHAHGYGVPVAASPAMLAQRAVEGENLRVLVRGFFRGVTTREQLRAAVGLPEAG